MRRRLAYYRWLWQNRSEWYDCWLEANRDRPYWSPEETLAAQRLANEIRSLILRMRRSRANA